MSTPPVQHEPVLAGSVAPATAFGLVVPGSPDYATLPLLDGFTWQEHLAESDPGQWYVVAFRSVRLPDADAALLTAADDWAYEEAARHPGFLHYFKGIANARGECLSFCVWKRREDAQEAGRQQGHQAAMQLTASMYQTYQLERYILRKPARNALLSLEPVAG
jgi:hypothetical protein